VRRVDIAYVEVMRDTSEYSAKTGRQPPYEDVEVGAGILT
jgi:hypothetical protein